MRVRKRLGNEIRNTQIFCSQTLFSENSIFPATYNSNIFSTVQNLFGVNKMVVTDVSEQASGELNESQSCVNGRRLYQYIVDERPRITEEDDESTFWKERAKCSRFSLLFPFFTALLFLADVGMDCEIAATHFMRGDRIWAAYTLGVVVFSLVITNSLSAIFYLEDQRDSGKTELLTKNNVQVKPWFYAFHVIFCGRLVRCFQIFKTVRLIRGIHKQDPDNKERYRLYISMLHDLSITGVVVAFTEEAPQVALQMYILVQRGTLDWTSFADVFVTINIIKSLALFSFSILGFCRALRVQERNSQLLELFSFASLFHFAWRLFMLVARTLALVLFASYCKHLVFIVVGIHLLFSYFILRGQPDNYFDDGSLRDRLLRCAFTCVNIFCFFPLAGERTRRWGIPYYLLTFTENSFMVLLWYFFSASDQVFKMTMLIIEWGTFLFGLVSMLLYYGVFHPSLKYRKKAPRADDVADAKDTIITFKQFESCV